MSNFIAQSVTIDTKGYTVSYGNGIWVRNYFAKWQRKEVIQCLIPQLLLRLLKKDF